MDVKDPTVSFAKSTELIMNSHDLQSVLASWFVKDLGQKFSLVNKEVGTSGAVNKVVATVVVVVEVQSLPSEFTVYLFCQLVVLHLDL